MRKRKRLLNGQVGYGLITYRRGTPSIYIHTEIFKGDERKRRVNFVRDMLDDWQLTPFENEGAIRTGIRSSLCLQGYSWQRSDEEASLLINSAFKKMDVKRPTWEEGQREYTIPRENCAWCGKRMPDDLLGTGRKFRYCSVVCIRAAFEGRAYADRTHYHKVKDEVSRLIYKQKVESRRCLQCGKEFKPARGAKRKLYCSVECGNLSRRIFAPKNCPNCGKLFHRSSSAVACCSFKCAGEYRNKKSPIAKCEYCRKPYKKRYPKMRFCSSYCARAMNNLESGRKIPRTLSAPVFDFFFSRAG